MSYSRSLLLVGSALALVSCGADDVASPGDGVLVVPAPAPAPAPAPSPTPTPTPTPTPPGGGSGAADDCPAGTTFTNEVITYGTAAESDDVRVCQLRGVIASDLRLQALPGVIYSFSGRVQVGDDAGPTDAPAAGARQATLTIDPGVVVFGSSGGDFLLVNRGSQLNVDGSEQRPVIMTSRDNVEGTATADSIGQWGGVVILGRAPFSDCATGGAVGGAEDCTGAVEGTSQAFFGGNVPSDNSGSIRYLQVRYPGFEVTEGNELNGITLAGVGEGTTFEYVQVHNSSDDGIEHFGGTMNARYVALTGNDDDSFDTDSGYKGFYQFVVITQRQAGGDRAWEADSSDNPNFLPRQNTRLVNATIQANDGNAILLRGGGDYSLINNVVVGDQADSQCLDIDGAQTVAAADPAADEEGPPTFQSVVFDCQQPTTDDDDGIDELAVFLAGGDNNNPTFDNTLQGASNLVNGPNESAVTAFDVTTLDDFLMAVDYIGAVEQGAAPWFDTWTCGLGSNPACEAAPQPQPAT